MKKSIKLLALTIVMVMTVSMLFAGCGKSQTFEEFCKSDEELMNQLESINMDTDDYSMTVEIKDNDVIYSCKYKTTLDEEQAAVVTEYFEQYMNGVSSTFESIAKQCEEQSEIDGIKVKVEYLNGDGSDFYSQEFTSDGE